MIRVERELQSEGGKWRWRVEASSGPVEGRSREPLLDACRALKRTGEAVGTEIGLFRPGRSDWDLRTTIGYGAGKTVYEGGGRPRLRPYRPSEER